jgi:hypothetical protein
MLEIITSNALAPRHGFFTRKGGASSGIFAGLNCGTGSSDQAEIVAINRARVAEAMGLGVDAMVTVHQVHSPDVIRVTGPLADKPRADAMVTATRGLALAVLTADCQPVLFADAKAGVIGAAHAGWKGAQSGVLEATIDAMEALGARRGNIAAVIGPCISQTAYEVGQEFFERFTDDNPAARRFFVNGNDDRYLFDLPSYGLWRLREAGVGHAEWTRHCTYRDPARFYSYRRTTHAGEADYGRLISVIRL